MIGLVFLPLGNSEWVPVKFFYKPNIKLPLPEKLQNPLNQTGNNH